MFLLARCNMRRLCNALQGADEAVSDAATARASFFVASAAMVMGVCFSNGSMSALLWADGASSLLTSFAVFLVVFLIFKTPTIRNG
jgi:hypothetical protein